MSVYDNCPVLFGRYFRLEYSDLSHCDDLLKVYSDLKSLPLFNSDNCGNDNFYYKTPERMKEAIEYWHWEYSRKGFVRMSIIDNENDISVGTVEMFCRVADDYFTDTNLLRIDLRSDFEKEEYIYDILSVVIVSQKELFNCNSVTTKAIPVAAERIKALNRAGFRLSEEHLIGHDGTEYSDYYIYFFEES